MEQLRQSGGHQPSIRLPATKPNNYCNLKLPEGLYGTTGSQKEVHGKDFPTDTEYQERTTIEGDQRAQQRTPPIMIIIPNSNPIRTETGKEENQDMTVIKIPDSPSANKTTTLIESEDYYPTLPVEPKLAPTNLGIAPESTRIFA